MTPSTLSASLLTAYHQTHYQVSAATRFTLRIDAPSPELLALHTAHRVTASAYLTAWNPFSQKLNDAENAARQHRLEAELARRGVPFLPGIGQHPSNDWPGEPSVLALGLTLDARALGTAFEQNAIVWAGADAVPRLVLLR
ncbi:MAG: DUF3293 domain-containing protein [Gemmatimonadales bacterium]|nr:DUF3293 domain-containing protein [Gemmatimonadales bacterium]